jgi:hypothetical protein
MTKEDIHMQEPQGYETAQGGTSVDHSLAFSRQGANGVTPSAAPPPTSGFAQAPKT